MNNFFVRTLLILFFFFQLFIVVVAEDKISLTLERAIELALETSPTVQILKKEIELEDHKIRYSKNQLWPKVDLNFEYRYEGYTGLFDRDQTGNIVLNTSGNFYTVGLEIEPEIFTFKKLSLAVDSTRKSKEIVETDYLLNLQEIKYNVARAFFNALRFQEILRIKRNSKNILVRNYQVAQELYKLDRISYLALKQMEVSLTNFETVIYRDQKRFEESKFDLLRLVGAKSLYGIQLEGTFRRDKLQVDYSKILNDTIENSNELNRLNLHKEINHIDLLMEKKLGVPRIVLFGNYTYRNLSAFDDIDSIDLGIYFNIPFSNLGIRKNKIQQAELKRDQIEVEKHKLLNEISDQLYHTIFMLEKASGHISNTEKVVEISEESLQLTEKAYKSGKLTSLDIENALTAYIIAKTNFINAQYDYSILLTDFKMLTGIDEWN